MKISQENTISQIGKTFWCYCYILYYSLVPLYTLRNIKDTYPALFIIFGSLKFGFFSNDAYLSSS